MDFKDKVVLVTSASSGIGKATAELFSKKGAKVALAARSLDEVKELTALLPDSLAVAVDMTKPQEVQQMIRQTQEYFGRIDVLINNAGQELSSSPESISINDFHRLMASDVYGPLIAMQTTIPFMKQQGGGAIINISSGVMQSARSSSQKTPAAKSVIKKDLLNTRTEYTEQGISVSLVYPRTMAADDHASSKNRRAAYKQRKSGKIKIESPESVAIKIVEAIEKGISVEFH
jgi:NADP-dependent 3-hydroxy acid dehydrogenase YdfG